MLRCVIQIGLALAVLAAPVLCCCNVRLLARTLAPVAPTAPAACCQKTHAPAAKAIPSCCHADADEPAPPASDPSPCPVPLSCHCLSDRPDAVPSADPEQVAAPSHTSDLPPVTALGHAGAVGLGGCATCAALDADPAADARGDALDFRHVLRC